MKRILTAVVLFVLPLFAFAQVRNTEFSQEEQQIINLSTPGLFAKSNTIQVDFSHLTASDYSFPLPVGKIIGMSSQYLRIETQKGDAVKAMFAGVVRLSYNTPSHGNVVVVRHDSGIETVYEGNAQNLVKVGTRVKAGQTVAIVGHNEGKYTCLFSIMIDGRRINPETILNVKSHRLRRIIVTVAKVGERLEISTKNVKDNNAEPTKQVLQKEDSKKPAEPLVDVSPEEEMRIEAEVASRHLKGADINPFANSNTYILDLSTISKWHYPLDDSHVISSYGGKRRHSGVDIKNAPNKEIYAVFDGIVVQSGPFSGYGKCITIQHENGLQTRYSHNSANYVVVGDKVKAGQVIGLTGRTGRATTEHLHFETRIGGKAFDPAYVFDHANKNLCTGKLQFRKGGGVVRLK